MFAWLKQRRLRSQLRGLQQQHLRLLEAARDLQRNGDIRGFADKTAEAETASSQIDGFLAAHPELAENAAGGSR